METCGGVCFTKTYNASSFYATAVRVSEEPPRILQTVCSVWGDDAPLYYAVEDGVFKRPTPASCCYYSYTTPPFWNTSSLQNRCTVANSTFRSLWQKEEVPPVLVLCGDQFKFLQFSSNQIYFILNRHILWFYPLIHHLGDL